jgi:hypothetical protein
MAQLNGRLFQQDVDLIYVRVGMYHGTEPLCQVKETRQVDHTNPKWDEWVDLEIAVPDIPRYVLLRTDYSLQVSNFPSSRKFAFRLILGHLSILCCCSVYFTLNVLTYTPLLIGTVPPNQIALKLYQCKVSERIYVNAGLENIFKISLNF